MYLFQACRARGAMEPPEYVQHITTGTPGFSDIPTALYSFDQKQLSSIFAFCIFL